MGMLFDLTMLFSPLLPGRSLFPQQVFLVTAVVIISVWSEVLQSPVLERCSFRLFYALAVLYMTFTGTVTVIMYGRQHQYMHAIYAEAESLRGKGKVMVISTPPPSDDNYWHFMSGIHMVEMNLPIKDGRWENVAFARYFGLKGVHVAYSVKEEQ